MSATILLRTKKGLRNTQPFVLYGKFEGSNLALRELEAESEAMFGGEIEVDESYFGGRRKGKRGRGAAGKTPVFGLLKGVEKFTPRLSQMLQEPL